MGKLSMMKRVRMTEEMALEIEAIGLLEHRNFCDQARVFIDEGLAAYKRKHKRPIGEKKELLRPVVASRGLEKTA